MLVMWKRLLLLKHQKLVSPQKLYHQLEQVLAKSCHLSKKLECHMDPMLPSQLKATAAMPKKAYPVECNQHKKVICRIKLTRRHKLLNRCLEESVHHYLVKYNRSRHKLKLSIMVKIKNKTKTKTKIQISQNKLTHHKKKLRCPKPHRKMANQI